ncbi:MAG: hypothetical protein MUF00_02580, partial [Gemmatimonadaceae bacterium]|nr:hypothetical protein [Gemmatimonadaceae bacterium]
IFIGVFAGIRIAFIWLATEVFIGMIPDGEECPICGDQTLPVQRDGWWRILGPRFRRSYCLGCQWEGVLRRRQAPPVTPPPSRTVEPTPASSPAPR